MMAMNVCAASCEMAIPDTTTAIAITSSWTPRRRQSRLPRTIASHQLVAHPADGLDVPGADGVVPELLAQLPDVHVDRPINHHGLVERVHVGEQLVAGKDPSRKLHQGLQQLVFDG